MRRSTLLLLGLVAPWGGACRDSADSPVPAPVPSTDGGEGESTPHGRLSELRAIGYSGWDEADPPSDRETVLGVTQFDAERTQDWVRVWADDASTVHRILPSGEELAPLRIPGRTQVEFARVLEGGRVLCLSVDEGITLVERSGEVVFHTDMPAHHDAVVVPDGASPGHRTFAVLVHREREYRGRQVRFDGIALVSEATGHMAVSPNGTWAWDSFEHRESLVAAIDGPVHALEQPLRSPGSKSARTYDYFHANAIAFDGPSRLTVCLRNVDAIVSLAWPEGEPLTAFGPGVLDWPHAPSFVDHGLLVFDNGKHRGWSRVVEISLDDLSIRWEWRGTKTRPLWSEVRGFAQRLPNGNTLITESERGRALEVTQDGSVVWEFLNPKTRQDSHGRAARRRIYRVMAFPPDRMFGPQGLPPASKGRADSGSGADPAESPR